MTANRSNRSILPSVTSPVNLTGSTSYDDDNVARILASSISDDQMAQFESIITVVIPVVYGLIAVLGLLGNLLVIVVLAYNRKLRCNTTNVLVTGLAVADLVFIVICVPFTAVNYALTVWPFGILWCKIYQYVIHVTAHASVYTLVLMSVDRYLAVVHPICSLTVRTDRNACFVLLMVWTVIVVANVPLLNEFVVHTYDTDTENRSMCAYGDLLTEESPHRGRLYQTTFFVFGYLLPLATVTLLYGCLVCRLLRGADCTSATAAAVRNGGGGGGGGGGNLAKTGRLTTTAAVSEADLSTPSPLTGCHRQTETMRARRRVTRMVVVVVIVFAACWLPLHVASLIQSFVEYRSPVSESLVFAAFKIGSNCLAYLNSCLNPILYAFLSDNFRNGINQACGRRPRYGVVEGRGRTAAGHNRTVGISAGPRRKRRQSAGAVEGCCGAAATTDGNRSGWFRLARHSEKVPRTRRTPELRYGIEVGLSRSANALRLPGLVTYEGPSVTMTTTTTTAARDALSVMIFSDRHQTSAVNCGDGKLTSTVDIQLNSL